MLNVKLVTPDNLEQFEDVNIVQFCSAMGEMGVMPGHEQMIVKIDPCIVTINTSNSENSFFVSGGFAEINEQAVTILVEEVINKKDLNSSFLDIKKEYLSTLEEYHPEYENILLTVKKLETLV